MSILRIDPDAIYTTTADISQALGISEANLTKLIHSDDDALRPPVRQFYNEGRINRHGYVPSAAFKISGRELLRWFEGLPIGAIKCE